MAASGRFEPVAGERPAARLTRPLREFLETEVAGGVVLLAAVVIALAWANSPWKEGYRSLWETAFQVGVADRVLQQDLRHWVNDGLMVVFFFVVGLEIKRELIAGVLNTFRKAILPTAAAVGGMVLPAAIYLAVNPSGEASRGWGIPMATDIAFALGVLALVGRGLPDELRVLLLSVAIVDDVGAIIVIAVFYSGDVQWLALGVAAALLLVIVGLRRLRVWAIPIYVIVGVGVWLAILLSGVHATIAGVLLGLLAPAHPPQPDQLEGSVLPQRDEGVAGEGVPAEEARVTTLEVVASVPVTDRLIHILHPWTSFVILPIFALANAGVSFGAEALGFLTSPVALGIATGLVFGKLVGISASSWLAVRLGAELPGGLTWRHLTGTASLAGIGFTMSLFIATLAFQGSDTGEQAKIGILVGSVVAASLGTVVLRTGRRQQAK